MNDVLFCSLMLVYAIGVIMILGSLTLVLIVGDQPLRKCVWLALGYLIGMGVLGQLMLLMGMCHIPLNMDNISWMALRLAVILMLLVKFIPRPQYAFFPSEGQRYAYPYWAWILLAYIALQITYIAWNAFNIPILQADAYSVHGYKAKVLFYEQNLDRVSSTIPNVYPLQFSLILSWIALCAQSWSEPFIKLIFVCNIAAFLTIVYQFTKGWTDRTTAVVVAALMLSSNFFVLHAGIAYMDFTLMVYVISAALVLLWGLENRKMPLVLVAGLLLALSTCVKREGMIYTVLILIVTAGVYYPVYKKELWALLVRLLAPLAVVKAVFGLYKHQFGISGLWTPKKVYLAVPEDALHNAGVIVTIALKDLFLSGNWNILWPALIIMVLLTWRLPKKKATVFLGWFLGACLLSYLAIAFFIKDFIPASLGAARDPSSRLLLQFFPLCPLLIVLLAKELHESRS